MSEKEFVKVVDAFIDVLDGQSTWYEIREQTGLSEERCKQISELFSKYSVRKYTKVW